MRQHLQTAQPAAVGELLQLQSLGKVLLACTATTCGGVEHGQEGPAHMRVLLLLPLLLSSTVLLLLLLCLTCCC
jgi:hypothetical protein